MQAVQGKLVPQDPNDEPASVLLAKIRAEKEQMMKEGKIKKEPISEIYIDPSDNQHYEKVGKTVKCIEDEIPFEIPKGWKWCRFNSIYLANIGGGTPSKSNANYWNGEISWASVKDLSKDSFYIDKTIDKITVEGLKNSSSNVIPKKNLIICTRMGLGKVVINNTDMAINQDLRGIIMPKTVNNLYIAYYYKNSKIESQGLTVKGIKNKNLSNMLIPLPPEKEQVRIINKVAELEPYIKNYHQLYEKINSINTSISGQLKKSILQYAIQGKLVEQNPDDEPASELIKRIRAEKEKLIKSGKLKKDKNESFIYRGSDNSYYEKFQNGKEVCIDNEIPFEIPQSWAWCRLSYAMSVYGGKRIPAGQKLVTEDTGHKYIRVTDMKNSSVSNSDVHYITNEVYEQIKRYTISCDDLYITVAGTIGKVGNIPIEFDGANLTENANKLITYDLDNDYVKLMMNSAAIQNQITEATTKVGQPKLAIMRIKSLLIPLPPIAEQQRIVSKIKECLNLLK